MKYRNLICFSSLALLSFTATAGAAMYSTNFESFTKGPIQGQDGWSVDATTAESLKPGTIVSAGGGLTWGARAASIGYSTGLSQANVYVSRTFSGAESTPLVGDAPTTFRTLLAVIDSDSFASDPQVPTDAVRDTFGFRLQDSGGANLFSLILTPVAQNPVPEDTMAYWYISWSTGANTYGPLFGGFLTVPESTVYDFSVTFGQGAGDNADFTASIGGSVFNGTIPHGDTASIKTFGAIWNTSNAASPGSNEMWFDGLSLVPETSSALLGMLGASVALLRRRRA